MKKVYFACSIRGGGDTSHYLAILEAIKSAGAEALSEVFVHDAINYGGSPLPSQQIYARDITMIQECDIVIAEVTNPSLGVGYELGYAEALGKPILCLFDEISVKKLSAMIEGNDFNRAAQYSDTSIDTIVNDFIANN